MNEQDQTTTRIVTSSDHNINNILQQLLRNLYIKENLVIEIRIKKAEIEP